MQFPSFVAGPIFMAIGFILCAVIVIGVKGVILFIKEKINEKLSNKSSFSEPSAPQKAKRKRTKPSSAKSISLNTDDIDRIYFKKSS